MNLAWYLARAGGLVSWGLLSFSVVWGLVLSTKLFRSRPRPAWTLDLHRALGGGALAFTGIHVAGLVADGYVHFGLADILVPFASSWHPVAVAWGVLALYLLVAVEVTSLAMRRLSNKTWKRIHRLSFGLFVFASIHAVSAGTDTQNLWVRWIALVVSAAVAFFWLQRVITVKRTPRAGTRPGTRPGTRAARAPTPPAVAVPEPASAGHPTVP